MTRRATRVLSKRSRRSLIGWISLLPTLVRLPLSRVFDGVHCETGINAPFVPVHAESIKDYKANFDVNTFGPLYLYQATYPLLIEPRLTESSTLPPPKFFITSTLVASTGSVPAKWVNGPYGASKAAVNHIARAIHHQTEESGAVVVPYHPGKLPHHSYMYYRY
jgi:norsolorinic acid ketoreductase